MNITAFIKRPGTVNSHEEILNVNHGPVRVNAVDSYGARLADPLPSGDVIVYDLRVFDEVERDEFVPQGHKEIENGEWVPVFSKETLVERIPRIETYAVTLES